VAKPADYGSLPFAEQIEFFRQKHPQLTAAWTDVYAAEHNHAFMVAGAAKADLLADLRGAVDKAIADGTTLQTFRKDFDALVEKRGWSYTGGRNWRTRVIFDTNLRQSYNAGREAQMADPQLQQERPYGLYRHGGSEDPRPEHLAWDGLVLPLNDPWWDTHTPQNGWGCKCKKRMISADDAKRMGLKVADDAPAIDWEEKTVGIRGPFPRTVRVPKGIDPGFEYRPGANRAAAMTPPIDDLLPPIAAAGGSLAPLTPRLAPKSRLLAEGLSDQEYVSAFLSEFMPAGDRQTYFTDVAGETLLISDQLLRERGGALKANKRGRGPYLKLLADTIKQPQEIRLGWAEFGGKKVPRRRYIARWEVEGEDIPALVVFETGPQGWVGVTAHQADTIADLDRRSREGTTLVWQEKK